MPRNPQTHVPGQAATNKRAAKRGNFFTVHQRVWPAVCSMGPNVAAAYLVIALGTKGDMVHSTWSIDAVRRYLGISRKHAEIAVKDLIRQGLLVVAEVRRGGVPSIDLFCPTTLPHPLHTKQPQGASTGFTCRRPSLWVPPVKYRRFD